MSIFVPINRDRHVWLFLCLENISKLVSSTWGRLCKGCSLCMGSNKLLAALVLWCYLRIMTRMKWCLWCRQNISRFIVYMIPAYRDIGKSRLGQPRYANRYRVYRLTDMSRLSGMDLFASCKRLRFSTVFLIQTRISVNRDVSVTRNHVKGP